MKYVFIYVPLRTGEVVKFVTTGRYQETGKEREACTPSALVTSNGTGSGPTTFSPQKQYVHETQNEPAFTSTSYTNQCLMRRPLTGCCACFQRHSTVGSKENQLRLKSLLSKNALRFTLKAGESQSRTCVCLYCVLFSILEFLLSYFWCLRE